MNKKIITSLTFIFILFAVPLGFFTIFAGVHAVVDKLSESDNIVYEFCQNKENVVWGIGGVHYCSGKPYVCSKQNCTWVSIHMEG